MNTHSESGVNFPQFRCQISDSPKTTSYVYVCVCVCVCVCVMDAVMGKMLSKDRLLHTRTLSYTMFDTHSRI